MPIAVSLDPKVSVHTCYPGVTLSSVFISLGLVPSSVKGGWMRGPQRWVLVIMMGIEAEAGTKMTKQKPKMTFWSLKVDQRVGILPAW